MQVSEKSIADADLCTAFVKKVAFYILTTGMRPSDSYDNWTIGGATTMDELIDANSKYLYEQLSEKASSFDTIIKFEKDTEDLEAFEDECWEAEHEIRSILSTMFPVIACLHGDCQDDVSNTFLHELCEIYSSVSKS